MPRSRVVMGSLSGGVAFVGAAYFGIPTRSALVFVLAAVMGLALGAFVGRVNAGS